MLVGSTNQERFKSIHYTVHSIFVVVHECNLRLGKQECHIQNCSQTAADRNVVTFDSLCKVTSPYPIIPSPTPYDVPFSHSTCVTDRQTTDTRHIVPQKQGQ